MVTLIKTGKRCELATDKPCIYCGATANWISVIPNGDGYQVDGFEEYEDNLWFDLYSCHSCGKTFPDATTPIYGPEDGDEDFYLYEVQHDAEPGQLSLFGDD